MLVRSTLDPSFYTLAKAKRGGSAHNRKPLVITVGPRQSQRVIASPGNAAGPSALPVSVLLSKENTDGGVFLTVAACGRRGM